MNGRLFFLACLLGSGGVLVQCQMRPRQNCTDVPSGCPADVQTYLTAYGYLDPDMDCDNFQGDLFAALLKFQEMILGFKGVNVTGECDRETLMAMNSPRCGCEDMPVKGKKMMPQNLLGPQEYRTGNTMWRKRALTWRVTQYPLVNRQLTHSQIDDAFRRALQLWADVADISFRQTSSTDTTADINIRFERRRHTATEPFFDFDGKGGVLAHAFFPESGVVHFDDDEKYVLGNDDGTELYIVAAHEFGHTLGISHSNINSALMAPYYRYSKKLELDADDIAAVRSIYGAKKGGVIPTQPPITTPAPKPTTVAKPTYCSMKVDGVLKVHGTTYVFTRERVGSYRKLTFVYTVTDRGLNPSSKTEIRNMFQKGTRSTYRGRPYPYRVDAATYIPSTGNVFLFSGTRVYRYTRASSTKFELDPNYPRWMEVKEFPERPRAAIAMPYRGGSYYYMLLFGSTMVWNWDLRTQKVGAWAYPITSFGRNMPLRMDGAFLQDTQTIVFIQGNKAIDFSIPYRRVMGEESKKPLAETLFKGKCL